MLEFWRGIPSMIDPVAFSVFGFEVRYYGLMYLVAFLVAYSVVRYRLKTEKRYKELSVDTVDEFFLVNILAVILGGRLGYVLFYNFEYYLQNPLQVIVPFDFATGQFVGIAGMSFHGGLITMVLLSFIYVRLKKVDFNLLVELFVVAAPLGFMFGRIGNFLNNELWGKPTEFFLGMQASLNEAFLRHPSQLYEAFFEGLVLFLLLWIIRSKEYFKGILLGVYVIGYGIVRFSIEFVRMPDEHLGYLSLGLSMGQWLSLIMILLGGIFIYFRKKANN